MKLRDKKDLFTKDASELTKRLKDVRDELFTMKLDLTQNKLKNTKSITTKRKEIALILTALKEKELANAKND
jgi:ribosomal protein L29